MQSRCALACLVLVASATASASLSVSGLRCEYLDNPIGIDVVKPRFFWTLDSAQRDQVQTGYRILVASSPDRLRSGVGDLWDSGKVPSSETIQVEYEGKPLRSRQQAWWSVTVWDRTHAAAKSEPAKFEIGLLNRSDWSAKWVGMPQPATSADDARLAKWIWYPEGEPQKDAPEGDRWFRTSFQLPGGKLEGSLSVAVDDSCEIWLNGKHLGDAAGWQNFSKIDLSPALSPGKNDLVVKSHNDHSRAGLLVSGMATSGPSDPRMKRATVMAKIDSGSEWQASRDQRTWQPSRVLAPFGGSPYGPTSAKSDGGPAVYLRRDVSVSRQIVKARIYASAHGLYELYVDGTKLTNKLFSPGWTDYSKRIQYQTYDVTNQFKPGPHTVAMIVGDGWYCGNVAWAGRQNYGPQPMGLAQIEITYGDGSKKTFSTDSTWSVSPGPILKDDLLMGEFYDARLEMPRWFKPGYSGGLHPVVEPIGEVPLIGQQDESCAVLTTIRPKTVKEVKPGVFVYDLGQNMVGHVRLRASATSGTQITLRHAEMLNPDGTIYTTNLRRAKATDTYVCHGGGIEQWEPRFTFHGFRYVEMTGYPGKPPIDAVEGIVVGTDTPQTGSFTTSDPLLNQLQHNIQWGQRSNYLEVPTDCPQRDERLGWMGDAQIFVRTATFNAGVASFMSKWTQDVVDGQKNGSFADVSPRIGVGADGSPAWGDAGVIVPWTIFHVYGDRRLLAARYPAMREWVEMIDHANPDHIWTKRSGANYGDWLNVQDDTPRDVVATAFFANSATLVANAAANLGKSADAQEFQELAEQIKEAFQKKFVDANGRVSGDSQTAYVLALKFNLMPSSLVDKAVQRLLQLIDDKNGHLSTGFLGCGYLSDVLSRHGHDDYAFRILMTRSYPGWLYPVMNGATTIWERWDGWTEAKGFQDPGMNSFNHYSFGAVGSWMYRVIGGIDTDSLAARSLIRVEPKIGGGLTSASTTYKSIRGTIAVSWKLNPGRFVLHVQVPPNCQANIALPVGKVSATTESGQPVMSGKRGILNVDEDANRIAVGSGTYDFSTNLG